MEVLLGLGALLVMGFLYFSLATYPSKKAKKDIREMMDREIEKLSVRFDRGELTQEEYDAEIKRTLNRWLT